MVVTTPPISCTIAGTDSGGSAGLAADLETFAAHHVHGVFAVTVVTAQNTTGIQGVESLPTTFVGEQLDAITSDITVDATKTGLLYSRAVLEEVAARLGDLGSLVVDPVLVTSAGQPMLGNDMPDGYIDLLFPYAAVITPNVAEAELLTGRPIRSRIDAANAARALIELGPATVVITGLLDGGEAVDTIATADRVRSSEHARITTNNVLGTGCSLSAAITARLSSVGLSLTQSMLRSNSSTGASLRELTGESVPVVVQSTISPTLPRLRTAVTETTWDTSCACPHARGTRRHAHPCLARDLAYVGFGNRLRVHGRLQWCGHRRNRYRHAAQWPCGRLRSHPPKAGRVRRWSIGEVADPAAIGAVVGFFVIPVVGIIVGAIVGIGLAEYYEKRDWALTKQSTIAVAKGFGLSTAVQFAIGTSILIIWLGWAGTIVL